MRACPKCGKPVPIHDGPGRPSVYCSATCRRLAELAIRRINKQMEKVEENASAARIRGRAFVGWKPPEVFQEELERLESRLRELLDAAPV